MTPKRKPAIDIRVLYPKVLTSSPKSIKPYADPSHRLTIGILRYAKGSVCDAPNYCVVLKVAKVTEAFSIHTDPEMKDPHKTENNAYGCGGRAWIDSWDRGNQMTGIRLIRAS